MLKRCRTVANYHYVPVRIIRKSINRYLGGSMIAQDTPDGATRHDLLIGGGHVWTEQ
jgi:hypothetical protein